MIDFGKDQEPAYLINNDELEVLISVMGNLRRPTPAERLTLDAYFATPRARNPETGRCYALDGQEIAGIDGDPVTYRVRPRSPDVDAAAAELADTRLDFI